MFWVPCPKMIKKPINEPHCCIGWLHPIHTVLAINKVCFKTTVPHWFRKLPSIKKKKKKNQTIHLRPIFQWITSAVGTNGAWAWVPQMGIGGWKALKALLVFVRFVAHVKMLDNACNLKLKTNSIEIIDLVLWLLSVHIVHWCYCLQYVMWHLNF